MNRSRLALVGCAVLAPVLLACVALALGWSPTGGDGRGPEIASVRGEGEEHEALGKAWKLGRVGLRPGERRTATITATRAATNEDPCGERSGARAVAHRAGGEPITSAAMRKRAPDSCLSYVGPNAAEPTLGVTKQGTIYYAAMDGFDEPVWKTHTMRSTDGGRTWEDVSPAENPGYSEDPYLYVDEDTDRVFALDLLLPCTRLSRSDDGLKWTTTVMGCDLTDFEKLFAGPAPKGGAQPVGYPNVVYFCAVDAGFTGGGSLAASCEKSLDGGSTFLRTGDPAFRDLADDTLHCGGGAFPGAVGPEGNVYLARGWGPGCDSPYIAISRDQGATWKRVEVSKIPSSIRSEVAVDDDGNVYFLFEGQDRHQYLSISRDQGLSWSKPVDVTAPGLTETTRPSIDVSPEGGVAIAYMGTTNGPPAPFDADYDRNVTWNGYITITDDALADDPAFFSGAVNDPAKPLFRGSCGGSKCGGAYDFIDVAITPEGEPLASFADGCRNDAETCAASGPVLSHVGRGVLGSLRGGPSLTGD